ncbi:MAG: CAP domain-containing protein [Gaiellaceae bacterium]
MSSSSRVRAATLAAVISLASLAAAPGLANGSTHVESGVATVVRASSEAGSAKTSVRLKALERKVLRRLNAYRSKHGRKAVRMQKQLRRAALAHARAMGKKGFFAHESANGEAFDKRIKRYYGIKGFRSWSVGENLVWASGSLSAKRAITLWDGSPGHRRNMREGGWRQIGVAAVRVRSAPGVFKGFDVTIIVTDFGTRT